MSDQTERITVEPLADPIVVEVQAPQEVHPVRFLGGDPETDKFDFRPITREPAPVVLVVAEEVVTEVAPKASDAPASATPSTSPTTQESDSTVVPVVPASAEKETTSKGSQPGPEQTSSPKTSAGKSEPPALEKLLDGPVTPTPSSPSADKPVSPTTPSVPASGAPS